MLLGLSYRVNALLSTSILLLGTLFMSATRAEEALIIAASPSMKAAVEALGQAFEKQRPEVHVRVYYDKGLDLRRTIAGMENNPRGKYFIGSGPIHLIAPGGDELIKRLEQKYYVLPGTRRAYVAVPLVLVVPATLVEAPASFEALASESVKRIAVADPHLTELGRQTQHLFQALGIWEAMADKVDVASDARGVLDHMLHGEADVGIIFGPDAYQESERVRVVAMSTDQTMNATVHSMAMERYCPNRRLCEDFLAFIQTPEAQSVLTHLGYVSPPALARKSQGK